MSLEQFSLSDSEPVTCFSSKGGEATMCLSSTGRTPPGQVQRVKFQRSRNLNKVKKGRPAPLVSRVPPTQIILPGYGQHWIPGVDLVAMGGSGVFRGALTAMAAAGESVTSALRGATKTSNNPTIERANIQLFNKCSFLKSQKSHIY